MDWVIAHSESIHGSPYSKLAAVTSIPLHSPQHNDRNQIRRDSDHDGDPTIFCFVTNPSKDKTTGNVRMPLMAARAFV
jgi:hypothetical protein